MRFTNKIIDQNCALCNDAVEDSNHPFFHRKKAKELWQTIKNCWPNTIDTSNKEALTQSLAKLRAPRREKQVNYVIVAVVVYSIWRARNEKIFTNNMTPIQIQYHLTREHIIQRTLKMHSIIKKSTQCIKKNSQHDLKIGGFLVVQAVRLLKPYISLQKIYIYKHV